MANKWPPSFPSKNVRILEIRLTIRREEKLSFELPKKNRGELQKYNVVAPNDNELDIMFLNNGWKFWYPNAITPVLQMQVSNVFRYFANNLGSATR